VNGGLNKALVAALLAALMLPSCSRDAAPTTTVATVLDAPRALPAVALTDKNGQPFSIGNLAGQPALVFFGFTHCPDICPLTLVVLAEALKSLRDEQAAPKVLFVSVDPGRDTPELIKAYVEAFDPEFLGATADEASLAPLIAALGVSVHKERQGGVCPRRGRALGGDLRRVGASGGRHRPRLSGAARATCRRMSLPASAAIQFLVPQRLSCRIVYSLSRSRRPWLKRLLISNFLKLYDVDMSEASLEDPLAYTTFNELFTRPLKPGARPLASDPGSILSPADGRLTEFGRIEQGRLLQAKGKTYTLAALLAETADVIEPFLGGSFLTIYLAPPDYHRVHTPVAGKLRRGRYIPGRRFSVNQTTAGAIDNVFCRNERVALWLDTAAGPAVVVMIGALNVASLSTGISGEIASGEARVFEPATPLVLARGAELGHFNLGSTVVVLFPRGKADWLSSLEPGQRVRMGQALGGLAGGS
jgi:phosphatidylserine decarboxylase